MEAATPLVDPTESSGSDLVCEHVHSTPLYGDNCAKCGADFWPYFSADAIRLVCPSLACGTHISLRCPAHDLQLVWTADWGTARPEILNQATAKHLHCGCLTISKWIIGAPSSTTKRRIYFGFVCSLHVSQGRRLWDDVNEPASCNGCNAITTDYMEVSGERLCAKTCVDKFYFRCDRCKLLARSNMCFIVHTAAGMDRICISCMTDEDKETKRFNDAVQEKKEEKRRASKRERKSPKKE
jgi:hypothetical protein